MDTNETTRLTMRMLLFLPLCVLLLTGCQPSKILENTALLTKQFAEKSLAYLQERDENSTELSSHIVTDFIPLSQDEATAHIAGDLLPQSKDAPSLSNFSKPTHAQRDIFTNIHFKTDDASIRSKEDVAICENIVRHLKDHPSIVIFVGGHCDQRASEEHNFSLGTRRANAVRSFLVKKGISQDRIFPISYGKEYPLDNANTKKAWAQNRRVEFKIFDNSRA